MQENLVIVESPGKVKEISKYLGKDYVVTSSAGHIRDLVKKGLGIDIDKGYELSYEIPASKRKVVDELKSLVAKSKQVWLASDEDREGEAIAWHLTQVLGLDIATTKRIVFHEITKDAILNAIDNPRTVDINLVDAQQARRVLDRLVGFELSPVLWRKVRPQLSAGRVQSVAVKLLVDREREIIAFDSTPYYRVVAQFSKEGKGDPKSSFKAELSHRFATREEAEAFLTECIDAKFPITKVEDKPIQRRPAAPFTTSTLQQEAGRKLGMSVLQTMSIAQKLYEQGLISYMRTDSVSLSQQALAMCREQIVKSFGEEYYELHTYKTKTKGAQEAHEAIRPTSIERVAIEGTSAEKRLYDLIWKRTVASQMVPAKLDRTIITVGREGAAQGASFSATGEIMRFEGFMKLYTESTDDVSDDETAAQGATMLPKVVEGEVVDSIWISATQRFLKPPVRFNEMSLVNKLEELGIGRPSTYVPTITTITNRGYVVKQSKEGMKRDYEQLMLEGSEISSKVLNESYGAEKQRLLPTDIAMLVTDYLEGQFSQILDYNFTANVEREFDRVAEGEISWSNMIDDFYKPFHKLIDTAVETQTTRSSHERILGVDPASGRDVKARIGRYGPMVEIVAPEGEKAKFAALKRGQLIESITLEQALELFALPRSLGEYEGEELVVGIGRFGPYVRQGKGFTSLTKSDDPYTITLERAVELIITAREAKSAANTPLKSFEEDAELLVKSGRYGPYIAYKSKNYRLPKGTKPEELTFEEAMKIISTSKK